MIYLYNNLTRKKEKFVPLVEDKAGLYTCGPTVYDSSHVGNMRAFITWDVLKRFLISQGFEVKHIMNVTDVGHLTSDADEGEDKMEVARQREKSSSLQIADKYFNLFQEDAKILNILPPTKYVRATALIPEQIDFVKELDDKGYLYKTSDGMYFDTSKDPEYGRLGRIDKQGLLKGSRIAFNPEKRNITDFAVWKFSPKVSKRDMEWDSPWGMGFPGWHLECSVISRQFLGDTFDIHTGGIDHLTVHHPNEMAQSKAVTGKLQAQVWLHNNFISYQDKRMAKSAGTFVRLTDICSAGIAPLAYRFFLLQTHYRKELAYSWDAIKAAHTGLLNIYKEISFYPEPSDSCDEYEKKFFNSLSNDLNTAKALDIVQRVIGSKQPNNAKLASLFAMDEVLGLKFREEWLRRRVIPESAQEILHNRKQARDVKDWELSDDLREKLMGLGIEVKDTKDGQIAALSK